MNIDLTANMVGLLIETIDETLESKKGVLEMFVEDGSIGDAQEWLKTMNKLRDTRVRLVQESGINPRK